MIIESKNEKNTTLDYLLTWPEKRISWLGNLWKLNLHARFLPKLDSESLSMSDFEVWRVIGVGGFSSVYEGNSNNF